MEESNLDGYEGYRIPDKNWDFDDKLVYLRYQICDHLGVAPSDTLPEILNGSGNRTYMDWLEDAITDRSDDIGEGHIDTLNSEALAYAMYQSKGSSYIDDGITLGIINYDGYEWCTNGCETETPRAPMSWVNDPDRGWRLYGQYCLYCGGG